jgi:hypothetical protein
MISLQSKIEKMGRHDILDELVDDGASRIASRVNNEGLAEQIEFLTQKVGMSEDEILSTIA